MSWMLGRSEALWGQQTSKSAMGMLLACFVHATLKAYVADPPMG